MQNLNLTKQKTNMILTQAAILRHGTIPKLEKELEELNNTEKNKILSDTVTEDDIAKIIAKWTNIPVAKLISSEKEKTITSRREYEKTCYGTRGSTRISK